MPRPRLVPRPRLRPTTTQQQVTGKGPLAALNEHLADPMGTTIFSKAVVVPGQVVQPECKIPQFTGEPWVGLVFRVRTIDIIGGRERLAGSRRAGKDSSRRGASSRNMHPPTCSCVCCATCSALFVPPPTEFQGVKIFTPCL